MNSTPRFQTVAEAAQAQSTDAVLEMLNGGHDIDAQDVDGNTALHWAAWFRTEVLVAKLLERGAKANVGNNSGESPVHWAAKSSNIQALNAMTSRDPGLLSQRDCDGFTPFIILAQGDNAPVMEWMYLKGISIEEQDNWGRTAIQWACYKGHRRTVQWLLSRSANIAHRDHEGMTTIHWAALKGHDQIAEMLIEVGAVHLLDIPDASGDTPVALAHRKKNRYLVMSFLKCQLFYMLWSRPFLFRNNFAGLFIGLIAINTVVFAFIVAPGIAGVHLTAVLGWLVLMLITCLCWAYACKADPGWMSDQTVSSQEDHLGVADAAENFDVAQPVESQMVVTDDMRSLEDGDELLRLEVEQNKFNYQRHLIHAARRKLEDGSGSCCAVDLGTKTRGAEFQPLMNDSNPLRTQQDQLQRASFELRDRVRATSESIGRRRSQALAARGQAEYVELLNKGSFKQVCVVCRITREMRSHHCKECGRCVRRLDHHCPWIDNCVGIGNQRTFYCFIVLLLATILGFYYGVGLYIMDVIFPAWLDFSLTKTLSSMWNLFWLIAICAFDLVWVAFVSALVARHTAYMATNVTTYEVLVRPTHMVKRFPKSQGRFWFLNGCDVFSAFRNCFNYWTMDMEQDPLDFGPADAETEARRMQMAGASDRSGTDDMSNADGPSGPAAGYCFEPQLPDPNLPPPPPGVVSLGPAVSKGGSSSNRPNRSAWMSEA